MNDLTADPPSIQSYGGNVNSIGQQIATDIDSRKGDLDATTDGLNTPAAFAGVVDAWSGICKGVSSEVVRAGDGTTLAGGDHDTNEVNQTSGMQNIN
ncbi:hypothetical protein [Stackebrandtia nassauensis]|uniref:WXG100 family type VII secretion target n=1 Tax=Stackebrandtia nassauensis (strain DSM 44728 / CIP 108903 / NRRL B-16338 / NBRC 102104 / LLR-40K-21) TaxID=446470 RepID=D3Q9Y3_STANL|nr:hypothetical protein [Stackebrandtia nassauensis]ADD40695.1 hypothetical protein Snas_0985 [Stackebrandtia nassauensis DSM 44728]